MTRLCVSVVTLVLLTAALHASGNRPRDKAITIVKQIQRADYEGDRAALKRLSGELAPLAEHKELAARVRYWVGFALWRRAINGFNEDVASAELRADLEQAVIEFNKVSEQKPAFVDAKIGTLSCLSLIGFTIVQANPARRRDADMQELVAKVRKLEKEIQAQAPDHPRLLWVTGPNVWKTPVERGGGEAKAMEMYQKGLDLIRKQKPARDPLEPSWGEPELLMNLAWSYLNSEAPDLKAAEQHARSALQLVPYWHYTRDILMPQIQEAKKKAEPKNP